MDSVGIMQVIRLLNQGRDLAGHKLQGPTDLYVGAAITPEQDPPGPMLAKFEAKVNAGTRFFRPRPFMMSKSSRPS